MSLMYYYRCIHRKRRLYSTHRWQISKAQGKESLVAVALDKSRSQLRANLIIPLLQHKTENSMRNIERHFRVNVAEGFGDILVGKHIALLHRNLESVPHVGVGGSEAAPSEMDNSTHRIVRTILRQDEAHDTRAIPPDHPVEQLSALGADSFVREESQSIDRRILAIQEWSDKQWRELIGSERDSNLGKISKGTLPLRVSLELEGRLEIRPRIESKLQRSEAILWNSTIGIECRLVHDTPILHERRNSAVWEE